MKVVVVGGSGSVGAMTVPALEQRHEVVVFDPSPPSYSTGAGHVSGSLDSSRQPADAMRGADALVYMAMGSRDGWEETSEWAESHFDVNVKWLWSALTAADKEAMSRVVHLSTMSVFGDYLSIGADEHAEPDATDVYGLTKRLGETVCAAAAASTSLSIVSLRLVGPMADADWLVYDDPELRDVVTSGSDVAAAVDASLAVELGAGSFRVVPVSGDWKQNRVMMRTTAEFLDWTPRARRDEPKGVRRDV